MLFKSVISIHPKSLSLNHFKSAFTLQSVHHLANVSQTSPAFGVFVGAVAAAGPLFGCDFFQYQRLPVTD